MFRKIGFFLFFILFSGSAFSQAAPEEVFDRLDQAIRDKQTYVQQKEARLRSLKETPGDMHDPGQQYRVVKSLYEEYRKYNLDSAWHYNACRERIGRMTGDREICTEARIATASLLALSGMTHLSMELIREIDRASVPAGLLPDYFGVYVANYETISQDAIVPELRQEFRHRMSLYRDSVLMLSDPGSLGRNLTLARLCADREAYEQAYGLLNTHVKPDELNAEQLAISYFSYAYLFSKMGERDSTKYYYALAAIEAITSANKEYVSLQHLARMLYEDGDLGRAYRYISTAIDDALSSNARMNVPLIASILPIISNAYAAEMEKSNLRLSRQFWLISLLLALLVGVLAALVLQMQKLKRSRQDLRHRNRELSAAIGELAESNRRLKESNAIKETYVARYMDLCSEYIGRVEKYRTELSRIARNSGASEVVREIRSSDYIDRELKEFYARFDATFLHLFPDFVERLNGLLQEDKRIVPKPGRLLNTELRIMALVRLGITDSARIAGFLRYSLKTVYNYRVKLRNSALHAREEFEKQVMEIGADR